MYDGILNCNYKELREKYPMPNSFSNGRKAVSLKNAEDIDSFSNKSDILVYYDLVDESTPLMIVERVPDEEFSSVEELEAMVDRLNNEISGYVVRYSVAEDKEFVDITLVKKNIYDALDMG